MKANNRNTCKKTPMFTIILNIGEKAEFRLISDMDALVCGERERQNGPS